MLPLVGVGLASEAVYLAIVLRLPWWRYGDRLGSWREILTATSRLPASAAQSRALFACLGGIAVLVVAYLWGWRIIRANGAPRGLVWGGPVLFAATLFWLLPITADLFVYLCQAHLWTDLGTNPFLRAASSFSDPLFSAYRIEYLAHPSVYGPAWVLFSAPGTAGPYDMVAGLAYLKGMACASYLGCAWLLSKILNRIRPESALEGIYLFAWNPLVLLMALGDGHNDIVMMAAVLLALWWLLEQRWALAMGALALGVWIKYTGVVFVPLCLWYALVNCADTTRSFPAQRRHRRWSVLVGAFVAVLAVSAAVLAPFGPPNWVLTVAERLMQPVNWQASTAGLPGLAFGIGLGLFAILYGVLSWRLARGRASFQALLESAFLVALLAFLLGAARSQPWHLIWPAALAGLSGRRWAWPAIVGLSVAMLAAQVWVEWGAPGLGTLSSILQ